MNSKAKQRAWSLIPDGEDEEFPAPVASTSLRAATEPLHIVVEGGQVGARLDQALGAYAREQGLALSRTRLKTLIEAGEVFVDGTPVRDAAMRLKEGAAIALTPPPAVDMTIEGEDIPLNVVYEDEHLIVIDKPAGLVVHPAPGHASGTLVNALLAHCGASLSGIGGVRRPGIVHRLDKDTTGLIVAAKSDAAHQGLASIFADHGRTGSLRREYRALVWGIPTASGGMVDAPIGRHTRMRERFAVVAEERGRHAVTHWELLEAFAEASLVRCALETGRTHQIRVHMTHLGHPLLGDPIYASGFKTKVNRLSPEAGTALKAMERQALHAATLGFQHPITGDELAFESPDPQDFKKLAETLRRGT